MEKRNRNIALVLIAAGAILLFSKQLGLFIVALLLVWLGIRQIHKGSKKSGYLALSVGLLMLLGDILTVVLAIIFISLGVFYWQTKNLHRDGSFLQKRQFIGSVKWDRGPWVLKNMSHWYMIGEVTMDLSLAIPEQKETTIVLQGVVADVDIIIPDDIGVEVSASALIGEVKVAEERVSGILNKVVWRSHNYTQSEQKVKLLMTFVIADLDVKVL